MAYLQWLQATLPRAWSVPAHIRLIAEALDAVEQGEIDRLAVHMPPRHGKTENLTIRFPIWLLTRYPQRRYLLTAYNERIAAKFGRRARNLAKNILPLAADKTAVDDWETVQGGGLMTRGVGSPPTGVGFDGIVIDDPVRRRADAESPAFRERAWDWYTDDLYTRLEPGGFICLVMTLWHEDDIGARAIASEPNRWHVLKLPALAEVEDPMGREPGQALWPERYPAAALLRTREVMAAKGNLRGWEALYQQRPTPKEGAIFRVSALHYVDRLPSDLLKVRGWDLAASEGEGARTAGVLMGYSPSHERYYVVDAVAGAWESAERNRVLRQTAERDGVEVAIRIPQDPGQAGKDQAGQLIRLLAGFGVKAVRPTGDKTVRADPLAAQVNAGNVCLLKAAWNADYVEELRTFPGRRLDQVDASADAFNELADRSVPTDPDYLEAESTAADYHPLGIPAEPLRYRPL
jgi:predicted phage terminase large subunit-like protein